jgi:hypothetical protein
MWFGVLCWGGVWVGWVLLDVVVGVVLVFAAVLCVGVMVWGVW